MNSTLEEMEPSNTSVIPISVSPKLYQETCLKFNQSDPFHIGDRYGGIPLNLLTNLIGWIILFLLFILIRKKVVRKIGLKLASDTIDSMDAVSTQWVHIFFGKDKNVGDSTAETLGQTESTETLCNNHQKAKEYSPKKKYKNVDPKGKKSGWVNGSRCCSVSQIPEIHHHLHFSYHRSFNRSNTTS